MPSERSRPAPSKSTATRYHQTSSIARKAAMVIRVGKKWKRIEP